MREFPAICNSCSAIFGSGIRLAAMQVTLVGNVVRRCPRCGGNGRVPDGTYNIAIACRQCLLVAICRGENRPEFSYLRHLARPTLSNRRQKRDADGTDEGSRAVALCRDR